MSSQARWFLVGFALTWALIVLMFAYVWASVPT
jgi:hypothetical protein